LPGRRGRWPPSPAVARQAYSTTAIVAAARTAGCSAELRLRLHTRRRWGEIVRVAVIVNGVAVRHLRASRITR